MIRNLSSFHLFGSQAEFEAVKHTMTLCQEQQVERCTHASVCRYVFLRRERQTASWDPPSGLCSASTQCRTCSENIPKVYKTLATGTRFWAQDAKLFFFLFFLIELDTCKVHEHWNYTLQRRCVLCEGHVEVIDEVLQWAGLKSNNKRVSVYSL